VTLTYDYDKNGNRISLDDGLIATTDYNYDLLNRLDDMTTLGQGMIDFEYDPLSRRTLIDRPNGTTTTVTYDDASRLDTITHALGPTTLASFDYGVDAVGKRTSFDQTRSAITATPTITFGYDETDQLASATAALIGGTDESYDYDALGNRIVSHLSSGHLHDAANRLLEDDAFCYAYDANGNLNSKTAKVAGACTGDVTGYTWDVENRLIRIDLPGGLVSEYKYDSLGRRIRKDVGGAATVYVYDQENILFEFDGAAALLARYTHGAAIDEPLLIWRDFDANGNFEPDETFATHTDGLGSVTGITNDLGAVVGETVYDGFGAIALQTGIFPQPYAFTGREFDSESGLYFYRARYYDPAMGRFIGEDPIGFAARDANLYRYVFNSPTGFTDPTGLRSRDPAKCALECAVVGGLACVGITIVFEFNPGIFLGCNLMRIPLCGLICAPGECDKVT
jgi:RHS repeat-associated protein